MLKGIRELIKEHGLITFKRYVLSEVDLKEIRDRYGKEVAETIKELSNAKGN